MVDAAFLDPRSHLRRSSEFSFAILARHNGNLLAATRVILERRKGHERTTAFTHKSATSINTDSPQTVKMGGDSTQKPVIDRKENLHKNKQKI